MLNTRTVLVLGAGASVPFKFPTGTALSEQIVHTLQDGQPGFRHLTNNNAFLPKEVNEFRDAFFSSGKNSIDSFLEHREDFLIVGKAAIAAALIPYEIHTNVFTFSGDNWLRYVFNQLATKFDEFKNNKLSIITFNYDRVVEHFFFTSLKNSYAKSDADCIAALQHIPIIHLHGRLGYLPWEHKGGRAFRPDVNDDTLKISIDNLKIIHEEIKDGRDEEFVTAKRLLSEAQQVYFMGFGFNQTNIERLNIPGLASGKSVSTTVGIGSQEMAAIVRSTEGRVTFQPTDCIGMCRDVINWK